jgi:hypothetical protein
MLTFTEEVTLMQSRIIAAAKDHTREAFLYAAVVIAQDGGSPHVIVCALEEELDALKEHRAKEEAEANRLFVANALDEIDQLYSEQWSAPVDYVSHREE